MEKSAQDKENFSSKISPIHSTRADDRTVLVRAHCRFSEESLESEDDDNDDIVSESDGAYKPCQTSHPFGSKKQPGPLTGYSSGQSPLKIATSLEKQKQIADQFSQYSAQESYSFEVFPWQGDSLLDEEGTEFFEPDKAVEMQARNQANQLAGSGGGGL